MLTPSSLLIEGKVMCPPFGVEALKVHIFTGSHIELQLLCPKGHVIQQTNDVYSSLLRPLDIDSVTTLQAH